MHELRHLAKYVGSMCCGLQDFTVHCLKYCSALSMFCPGTNFGLPLLWFGVLAHSSYLWRMAACAFVFVRVCAFVFVLVCAFVFLLVCACAFVFVRGYACAFVFVRVWACAFVCV